MSESLQTERLPPGYSGRTPGYFPVDGAALYTVLHHVENPVARILLVGSFASERHTSYRPWIQWARYLAARRIEALRFDYRGVGRAREYSKK